MTQDRFPPLEELVAGVEPEYERGFIELEFTPGLSYYLARVDRLALAGDVVLDAGCGAGQWSLALAKRFRRVEAIDLKPGRLEVLRRAATRMGLDNIVAREASIEQLPLQDASVDAVVCYGVIMFTDVARVLREMARVLRPGGRVYVVLNADGFSRVLIERRGPREPEVLRVGEETIYATAWRRAIARGLVQPLRSSLDEWRFSSLRADVERAAAERAAGRPEASRDLGRIVLSASALGQELIHHVRVGCLRLTERLHDDAYAVASAVADGPAGLGPTRTWLPDEVEPLAAAAGLVDFVWATEAGLECAWPAPAAPPRYDGLHQGQLAVWEFLATKPAAVAPPPPDPARHLQAARAAREVPVFIEASASPVVANRTRTYPAPLFEQASALAAALGGDAYLRALARAVVGDASGEPALRRLLAFVRAAIVRDPVAQPLGPDAGLPPPLVTLLAGRGRCGHCAALVVALAGHAGLQARVKQLPRHVVAEVEVEPGRWALADADAFKHIDPEGPGGRLPTLEEVEADPMLLDRVPATGWLALPGSRAARGALGTQVRGYIDAVEPHDRGFVSGHYLARLTGRPPTLPRITRFERRGGKATLEWTASRCDGGQVTGYRVAVSARSRGWSWADPGDGAATVVPPPGDVATTQTAATSLELDVPAEGPLFASVTALSDRARKDPRTWFWPSEEATLGP